MFDQDAPQLIDEPVIAEGIRHITNHDPVFKATGIAPDDMDWPCLQPGFPGMLALILGQQISFNVAGKLWQRLVSELAGEVTPASFLALPQDVRQRCGLSRQKDSYACELARNIMQGHIDMATLETLDDEDALEMLTGIRGIGTWSAQLYLIFALARPDIWPTGDLGIRSGVQIYHRMDARPDHNATQAAGELFRPYRTAGALLMWDLKRYHDTGRA